MCLGIIAYKYHATTDHKWLSIEHSLTMNKRLKNQIDSQTNTFLIIGCTLYRPAKDYSDQLKLIV